MSEIPVTESLIEAIATAILERTLSPHDMVDLARAALAAIEQSGFLVLQTPTGPVTVSATELEHIRTWIFADAVATIEASGTHVVVPLQSTEDMIMVGAGSQRDWAAMLAARPKVTP